MLYGASADGECRVRNLAAGTGDRAVECSGVQLACQRPESGRVWLPDGAATDSNANRAGVSGKIIGLSESRWCISGTNSLATRR